jgi:RHS repeat-associated protein
MCIALAALSLFPVTLIADTVPGTLPGQFSVDPTGAANYKLDISVPPGVAGMQPTLALLYSSRGGNGQLGVGWSLSGLSAVTRCPQTLAQDNATGSVNLDLNDRFCLDGQRLMNIASGASYWKASGANEYRTEIESFQRVLAKGSAGNGPQYFEIFDKAGLTRWYGDSADATDVGADGATRIYWPVNQIRDRFGNEIDFKYSSQNGDYRLSEIDYSNNAGDPIGKIVFNYQSRPDTSYGFLAAAASNAGTLHNNLYRLSSIAVSDANQIVRTYKLSYKQASGSGLSLLASAQVCAPTGDCMPATQFTWQESTPGFNGTTGLDFGIPNNLQDMHPMDVDGDGLMDYVYVSGGTWRIRFGKDLSHEIDTGVSTDNMWTDRAVAVDVNGDGLQDLLVPGPNTQNQPLGGWEELLSNGSTLVGPAYPAYQSPLPPMDSDFKNPIALDMNGDGHPEMLYKYGGYLAAFSIGSGGVSDVTGYPLTADQRIIPIRFAAHAGADIYVTAEGCTDPNGGGAVGGIDTGGGGIHLQQQFVMREILKFFVSDAEAGALSCWDTAGVFEWQGGASGSLAPVTDTSAGILKMDDPVFLDVNGDGLTDVAYLQSVNGSIDHFEWNLEINHGGKWVLANWDGPTTDSPTDEAKYAQVIDYNHDGLGDILYPVNGSWQLMESTGDGLHSVTAPGISYTQGTVTMDVNGDGIADLMYPGSSDQMVIYGNSTVAGDVLAEITNGLGHTTDISYEPWSLTYGPDYETSALLDPFKVYKLTSPMPVVTQFSQDTGTLIGGSEKSVVFTSYHYWDGKIDATGRGFLGFAKVESYNTNTKIVTENDYAQLFPYTGMVSHVVQYVPDQAVTDVGSGNAGAKLRESCTPLPGGDMTCDFSSAQIHQSADPYNTAGLVAVIDTSNTLACIQPSLVLQAPSANSACDSSVPFNYPYVSKSIETLSDLKTGTAYKKTTTLSTYNSWGEATNVKVTTQNLVDSSDPVHVTNTSSSYGQDNYSNWCLDRLTDSTAEFDNDPASVRKSAFSYRNDCLLQEEQANVQDTDFKVTKVYGYDSFGNQTSVTVSAAGVDDRTTKTTYDNQGLYPVSVTNPLLQTSTATWDPRFGEKISATDANGVATMWSYDAFGRKTEEDDDLLPAGTSAPVRIAGSSWTISACSSCAAPTAVYQIRQDNLVEPGDPDHHWTVTEYDDLNRAVFTQTTGLYGKEIDQFTLYDPLGRRYMVSDPIFANDLAAGVPICWAYDQYDALGRVTAEYRPASKSECSGSSIPVGIQSAPAYHNVTRTAYNAFTTTVTDANGHTAIRQNNVLGKVMRVTDADNQVTRYTYDSFGNTKQATDPDGKTVAMDYDSTGHKTDMSDPDMGNWTYHYNPLGELVSQTDSKGNTVTQKYDKLGRLIERDEAEGTTLWKYDIGYGAGIGKLAYVSGPNGYWEGYAYNAYGDPTDKIQIINGKQYWFTTTYNQYGQTDTLLYPDVNTTAATGAPTDSLTLSAPPSSITGLYPMTWNTTQDGAIYHLYRARDNDDGTVATLNDASEVYSGPYGEYDESLTQPGIYRYWLKACYADSCGAASTAVVTVTVPPQPGAFSVTESGAGSGQFTASWSDVNAPEYRLHQANQTWPAGDADSALGAPVYDGTADTTILTLDDGTYYFAVSACSQVGCSDPVFLSGSVRELRKPVLPTGLTSPTGDADGAYTVNWSESDAVHAKYFELDEATNSSFSAGLATYQVTAPTISKDISRNVTSGDPTYYYRVRACNQDAIDSICSNNSTASSTHVIPPPAKPTNASAPYTNHNGIVKVTWTDGGGGTPAYYVVTIRRWRCIDLTDTTNCFWSVGTDTSTANTSLNYPGLTDNTYDFLVKACNDTACTDQVDAGSTYVTLTPGVPGTLTSSVTTSSNGSYTLSWGAASGTVTDYQLYRATSSSFSGQTRINSVSTARSYAESGRSNGTYYYHVRACNTGTCSNFGNTATVTVYIPPSGGGGGGGGAGGGGGGGIKQQAVQAPTQLAAPSSTSQPSSGASTPVSSGGTTSGTSSTATDSSTDTPPPGHGADSFTRIAPIHAMPMKQLAPPISPAASQLAQALPFHARSYPPLRRDWRVQAHYQNELGTHLERADYTPPPSSKPATTAQMIQYTYDGYGHLQQINAVNADNTLGVRYWVADAANASGQLQAETLGTDNSAGFNGITIGNCYEQATGRLTAIQATLATSLDPCNDTGEIESDSYSWDAVGNLSNRTTGYMDSSSQAVSVTESFTYDALNRLTGRSTVPDGAAATGENYGYDAAGNLVQQGANTLVYGATSGTGPTHAVTDATLDGVQHSYHYDANGNLTDGNGNTYTWSSYNKPLTVTGSSASAVFTYSPDRSLLTEDLTGSAGDHVQILDLGLFEVVDDLTQGKVTYRHTIEADGAAVAEVIEQEDGSTETNYYVHDHLGSVTVTLDATGHVLNRARHGAWGEPEDPKTGIPVTETATDGLAHQGYTGHIDLTSLGIIHMGGRIYSIPLHRFLSADPNVQFPLSSQGYNRYAYVNNNPLSETDPTGYYSLLGAIVGGGYGASHPQSFGQGLAIAAPFFNMIPYCAAWCTAISEATAGYLMTGDSWTGVKMGILSYAGASAASGINSFYGGLANSGTLSAGEALFADAVTQGLAQGLLSQAGGGRFGDGFLGAFAGTLVAGPLSGLGRDPAQIIAAMFIGGSVSYIGGGKFANGAISAGFAAMFRGNSGDAGDSEDFDTDPAKKFTSNSTMPSDNVQRANLKWAVKTFGDMYNSGLLNGLGYGFINGYDRGLSNGAFNFYYVPETNSKAEAVADIYGKKGIKVYRGGAVTRRDALDTVAHEIWHLQSNNMRLWSSGTSWNQGMAQYEAVFHAHFVVWDYDYIWRNK